MGFYAEDYERWAALQPREEVITARTQMTPEEPALELHKIRRQVFDVTFKDITEWDEMPENYRRDHLAIANALLDKYDIREKGDKLDSDFERWYVRNGEKVWEPS